MYIHICTLENILCVYVIHIRYTRARAQAHTYVRLYVYMYVWMYICNNDYQALRYAIDEEIRRSNENYLQMSVHKRV